MLIIGVGNELRGDDAAGLYAARVFNAIGVSAMESNGDGASLIELWKNHSEVIVIDAAKSGAFPGTIHRYEAHQRALPADVFTFSSHQLGLREAIELSRALGGLPEKLIIYAIEGKSFELNQPISQEVKKAIHAIVTEMLRSSLRISAVAFC